MIRFEVGVEISRACALYSVSDSPTLFFHFFSFFLAFGVLVRNVRGGAYVALCTNGVMDIQDNCSKHLLRTSPTLLGYTVE